MSVLYNLFCSKDILDKYHIIKFKWSEASLASLHLSECCQSDLKSDTEPDSFQPWNEIASIVNMAQCYKYFMNKVYCILSSIMHIQV